MLEQALTHRSYGPIHNEKLEFLGDAVLGCAVTNILYFKYQQFNEGFLSRLRANLVKEQALVRLANFLELSKYLKLGDGEIKDGGLYKASILADAFEAIIAAIFIDSHNYDGGFLIVKKIVSYLYEPFLAEIYEKNSKYENSLKLAQSGFLAKDNKSILQEYLQGRKFNTPKYSIINTYGSEHNQGFEVECAIYDLAIVACGYGASKRAAEQEAASLALSKLQKKAQLDKKHR